MSHVRILLALVALAGLSAGCTTLDVDIPTPEVQSPEVVGESWSGKIGLGVESAANVEVSGNAGARPPNVSAPQVKGSASAPLFIDLGIGSRFQIGVKAGITSGAIGSAKYQLIGKPGKEAASGNHSLAVYGIFGSASGSASGTQAVLFGPGGFPWSAKANVAIGGAGVSYGIRFTDTFMAYVGHAQDWYRASGEIVQSASSDASSAGGTYTFSQSGEARASALGLMTGKTTTFSVQGVYRHFEWTNARKLFGPEYSMALKFGF